MRELYVIDTNAIISFFDSVFKQSKKYSRLQPLSKKASSLIQEALISYETTIRLSIPTIVFIEIYEKWLISEEFCMIFYHEVFIPIVNSPNIEIKPIDKEVLENLLYIGDKMQNHDLHDRLVIASAKSLNVPLITSDRAINRFISQSNIVPHFTN